GRRHTRRRHAGGGGAAARRRLGAVRQHGRRVGHARRDAPARSRPRRPAGRARAGGPRRALPVGLPGGAARGADGGRPRPRRADPRRPLSRESGAPGPLPGPLKVLVVFGTRPEAIKLAPVIRELRRRSAQGAVQPVVCVTGQHREMLDQVLGLFRITPDYDLGIMETDQTPAGAASAVLAGLEPVLARERPDWALVQGDTVTVAAAALAAYYGGVRVGHVEAGLRTYDKARPFPEEINRRVAGLIADRHFAPTAHARRNLLGEGVPP